MQEGGGLRGDAWGLFLVGFTFGMCAMKVINY